MTDERLHTGVGVMPFDPALPRLWLRQPLALFDPLPVAADATDGLVIAGGRIVERVARGCTPRFDHVFDAAGLVLLPGLVNTHHHFYQTLTRAYAGALDKPLFPWLQSLYPVWQALTPEMIEVATELALTELLLSGCTTSVDHHYVFNSLTRDGIDRQHAAAARVGMRVVLTRGSMSLGHSAGGLPPDAVVESHDQILRDSERLIDCYHDASEDSRCRIALAPCSPFSVTPELMRDTATLAAHRSVLLHTHLAETVDENRFCVDRFGMRPLDLLEEAGWLRAGTWLAHGIHFLPDEMHRLAAASMAVSHCPSSNMLLGSGICAVSALEAAGVGVGLGVDGSASNDGSNLIQEARQALLLARLSGRDDDQVGERSAKRSTETLTSHRDALRWSTLGGARLLQFPQLGHLEVGALADIALFDLEALRFSGSDDPLAALLLCGAHQARHVMVGGEWRVLDGQVTTRDVDALQFRHRALAHQLCHRIA